MKILKLLRHEPEFIEQEFGDLEEVLFALCNDLHMRELGFEFERYFRFLRNKE